MHNFLKVRWIFLTFCCQLQYSLWRLRPYKWLAGKAGVCCGPCNPTKWEADIWGWLEVRRSAMLHYTVNQRLHWACRQYGHSGGTWGWLGVKRCHLCLQDTSHSAKWHQHAAVGHWVPWLIVHQDGDYLYPSQYSQTICRSQFGWYWREH